MLMLMRDFMLVVEDDEALLQILVEKLEGAGYNVTSATDAKQAFVQAEGIRPFLIITDIQMPTWGSGVDAYNRLQKSPITKGVPVIFITGMPSNEALKIIPRNPRVRLVLKPVDFPLLRRYIKELTGKDRPI